MMRMRRAGFTYKEIANKANIPWGTVRYRLQSWGVVPDEPIVRSRVRPRKYHYPAWLLQMMYWDCELSTIQIGYELDIPDESVCAIMSRLGVRLRTQSEAQRLYARKHPGARNPNAPTLTSERAREMAMKAAANRARRVRNRDKKRRDRAQAAKAAQEVAQAEAVAS